MVGLLNLGGNGGCKAELAQRLALLLDSEELPDLDQLRFELALRPADYQEVTVMLPELGCL